MSDVKCDQPGCDLGPLTGEDLKPRYYRLKDGTGPVLRQHKHDACHVQFLAEKKGFEVAEGYVEPPPRPEHEHYGTEAERRMGRTVRHGNATVRFSNSKIKRPTERPPLPLGIALRARMMRGRGN